MDTPNSNSARYSTETRSAGYRHHKDQDGQCDNKDLTTISVKSPENAHRSPMLRGGSCVKANLNSNNNHSNTCNNNASHKSSLNGWHSMASTESSVENDSQMIETVEGTLESAQTPPPSSDSPSPRSPFSSPQSKRQRRSSSSSHGHDDRKKRNNIDSKTSPIGVHSLSSAQQTLNMDESAKLEISDSEDDEKIDHGKKFKIVATTLSSSSPPAPCHLENCGKQDRFIRVGGMKQGSDTEEYNRVVKTDNIARTQVESRPSAIVKVKSELLSPSQSFHSAGDCNNEISSSPTSGPDSSISEGRGVSMASPSSCPVSREPPKTIFCSSSSLVSPGASPRLARSPSPTGMSKQPELNPHRQLQNLHQHYSAMHGHNYPYPPHFLGQLYPPHKVFPNQYNNNSHHLLHPQLSQHSSQQHHDFLTTARRATSTSSSSPSSSSLPPSPDFHHNHHPHHQQHNHHQPQPDNHLPPLSTSSRPQQLSPKASNFSIAAILGGSCSSRNTSSSFSSSSTSIITSNDGSSSHRGADSGRSANSTDNRASAEHAETSSTATSPSPRYFRRSPAHNGEIRPTGEKIITCSRFLVKF